MILPISANPLISGEPLRGPKYSYPPTMYSNCSLTDNGLEAMVHPLRRGATPQILFGL